MAKNLNLSPSVIVPTTKELDYERQMVMIAPVPFGKGVFARQDIEKNTPLLVYPGVVQSSKANAKNITYTWAFFRVTKDGYIDKGYNISAKGARFENYAAPRVNEPPPDKISNLRVVWDLTRRPSPAIVYWTTRNISKGDQLFVCYGGDFQRNYETTSECKKGQSIKYVSNRYQPIPTSTPVQGDELKRRIQEYYTQTPPRDRDRKRRRGNRGNVGNASRSSNSARSSNVAGSSNAARSSNSARSSNATGSSNARPGNARTTSRTNQRSNLNSTNFRNERTSKRRATTPTSNRSPNIPQSLQSLTGLSNGRAPNTTAPTARERWARLRRALVNAHVARQLVRPLEWEARYDIIVRMTAILRAILRVHPSNRNQFVDREKTLPGGFLLHVTYSAIAPPRIAIRVKHKRSGDFVRAEVRSDDMVLEHVSFHSQNILMAFGMFGREISLSVQKLRGEQLDHGDMLRAIRPMFSIIVPAIAPIVRGPLIHHLRLGPGILKRAEQNATSHPSQNPGQVFAIIRI